MFGAAPDLLCGRCAGALRERLAPKATGRLLSSVVSGPFVVTATFLVAAVGLYVVELVAPRGEYGRPDFLWRLHLIGPFGSVYEGEPWRLVTAAFLHGGLWHIALNGMALWWIGRAVEATRGPWGYAVLFLGSAVAGNAAEAVFVSNPVGLSGGLFGLCGYLWTWRNRDPLAASIMHPGMSRMIVAILVIGVFLSFTGSRLQLANWAHGGGLAWGALAGWATQDRRRRALWFLLLGASTVGLVAWVSTGHYLRVA
jgi:membrane associated rhomboid family serine protease